VADRRAGWKSPLVGTFAGAVVLLVVVSGWLLTDPSTTHADALRTGGRPDPSWRCTRCG
jgi:hypothetical protein